MSRRALAALLLLAAAGLVVVWRFEPAGTPPVYDGICIPGGYQRLGSSPAPTSASKQYPAEAAGAFQTSEIVTGEQPPQAQLLMTDGTFVSSQPFTITITPVAPPQQQPSNGTIDGNVYRITATTSSGAAVQPLASQPMTLLLRATASNPPRTLERFDGSTWTPLKTANVSSCGDIFEATTTQLGEFAMVAPKSSGGQPAGIGGGGGGVPIPALVAAATAVMLVVVLGLVRLARSRAG